MPFVSLGTKGFFYYNEAKYVPRLLSGRLLLAKQAMAFNPPASLQRCVKIAWQFLSAAKKKC